MTNIQMQCLTNLLWETETGEQTQELRLSDGMPDVGRVIGAWGQCVLRSKEWHKDHIFASSGMLVWVLYESDGEENLEVLTSWIPFQLRWELPEDTREGEIRLSLRPRFVDARTVSPRKILVRAGMAAQAEALVPEVIEIPGPSQQQEIPVLTETETVRVRKEAGEKSFQLEDALLFPESAPVPEKLVYSMLVPGLTDVRVLGDKLVFRGNGLLHVLCQCDDGQVRSWDFKIPFSQYTQLGSAYGNDAVADIRFALTGMETDLTEDGKLQLKCALTAQYVITDRETVTYLKDAYHPQRELQLRVQKKAVPVLTEYMKKSITAEGRMPADADVISDVLFYPDYPLVHSYTDSAELSLPGSFLVLHYGPDRKLNSSVFRWEGKETVPMGENTRFLPEPEVTDVHARAENGGIQVNAQMELVGWRSDQREISMITELEPGQEKQPDASRPSLILLRCGKDRLWDIAKRTGSTVEKIAEANGLEGECMPGQLLLIPLR